MHTHSHRFRTGLALLAAAGLLFAACGNADDDDDGAAPETTDTTETSAPEAEDGETGEFQPIEGVPGVTDDEIQFAVLGTGPANPLGYCLLECFEAGVKARLDYQNSLGGVHGRDVVVSRTEDDEVGNTQVKLLELIDADDVFGIMAAPLLYAGYDDVGNSGVPLYTTFPASPEADGHQNIYVPSGTLCIDCPSPPAVQAASLVGATKAASLGLVSPRRRRTAWRSPSRTSRPTAQASASSSPTRTTSWRSGSRTASAPRCRP